MKVDEIMTRNVQSCSPETNLATAAMLMWDHDCGVLPVVDSDDKVIGVITDRDICMAAATKHADISTIKVDEIACKDVHSCAADASISKALEICKEARVRRLPVVDASGKLQGILSLNDVVLHASEDRNRKTTGVSSAEVINTLKSICAPHSKTAVAATGSPV